MEQNKDVIDALIAEGKKSRITINGREFIIGKLNAITYFKLSKLIVRVGKKYKDAMANFNPTETNAGDIMKFLNILDEADFLECLCIFLPGADTDFCAEVEGEELLNLVEAIAKHNNFEELLKKVKRVIDQFKSLA